MSSTIATGERVLAADGRFYSPVKDKRKHAEEIRVAQQASKVARLSEIEEKMQLLEGENIDLKATVKKMDELNELLNGRNAKLIAELKAYEISTTMESTSKKKK